jgi:hypothetical protein
MEIIKAVLIDLFRFVLYCFQSTTNAPTTPLALPEEPKYPKLSAPAILNKIEQRTYPVLGAPQSDRTDIRREYVSVAEADVFLYPTATFDGVITTIPYGTPVTVLHPDGRFVSVSNERFSGWMLKDTLAKEYDTLIPMFTFGDCYDQNNLETIKLRSVIQDCFRGGAVGSPLSAPEYVTYRLHLKNIQLPWGNKRPRVAGNWQKFLKGTAGIHVGIVPKTGAIMEYQSDFSSLLAYVEAVFPDETIRISQILEDDNSRFVEQVYTKEDWKELRPVFIEVL